MKKYLVLVWLSALFVFTLVFACAGGGSKKHTSLEDSLLNVNSNIKNELQAKEELLNTKELSMAEFISSFNEIQKNLNEIKEKEKIISLSTKGKDLQKSGKDQIINDIQAIYDLLDKNKHMVSSLNKKLKNSNLEVDDVKLALTNLKNQVTEKETEITDLKNKLESLNVDFANLKKRYVDVEEESELKTEKLNTAYYVIGTKNDLASKGIITKKGGFIGIGKVVEMNASSIGGNYFTKIDITQTMEIPIHGDKVKLVSIHPADSYKLVEGTSSIDKIVIINPEKFWSASKYLVITSEK